MHSTTSYLYSKLLLFVALAFITLPALCLQGGLARQIGQLAHSEGFKVRGLNLLGNTPAGIAKGSSLRQLRTLLKGFDYVIVHGTDAKVRRLIIVGHRRPAPPPPAPEVATYLSSPASPATDTDSGNGGENVIPVRREGHNHVINAVLLGTNGQQLSVEMLIDTTASITVLPKSLAEALGLSIDGNLHKKLTTIKGQLQVKVGVLPALELGKMHVSNLDVAFAENAGFGERGLLGMNLLKRYIFILDDEHNELTLVPDPH